MTETFDEENYKEGYELFLPLAEQGDADMQCKIGLMHAGGLGVLQDYRKALRWYQLAAKLRKC